MIDRRLKLTVFVIALLLGLLTSPWSRASNVFLFDKAFILSSIEINNVVSTSDGFKYDGKCGNQISYAANFGANYVNHLNQPPFEISFQQEKSCERPMTFNYIQLIVPADGNLTQSKLMLGILDSNNNGIRKFIIDVNCTPTPYYEAAAAATRARLECDLKDGTSKIVFLEI